MGRGSARASEKIGLGLGSGDPIIWLAVFWTESRMIHPAPRASQPSRSSDGTR